MSMDLGELHASVKISVDQANRDLDELKTAVDQLTKALNAADKNTIDVKPKGKSELDGAGRSAEALSKGLDKAGKSAKSVEVNRGLAGGLESAAGAAESLSGGLQEAGAAAGNLGAEGPGHLTGGLESAGKSASDLAAMLNDAAAAAGNIDAPNVAGQLQASAAAAGQLADQMGRASSASQEMSSAGSGLPDMQGKVSGLGTALTGVATKLGAAASASVVFSKGWGRLTSIESAQAKLRGLGHEADAVAGIMESANASVKGTAYGLGEAATAAANAVASGIEPGSELTTVLTTIADTAAISGSSMQDMGTIFGSVMSRGKLQGDDMLQLLGRGIPVLQMLGDELGLTAAEVSEMATKGEIDFQTFERAMRSHVGGAAQELGNTATGAIANFGAAIGRLGAALMDPAFSALPSMLGGVTEGVNLLTAGTTKAFETFSKLPEPVQQITVALAAAKAGSMMLQTELGQKLVGKLNDLKSTMLGTGGAIKSVWADMGAAYRNAADPLQNIAQQHLEIGNTAMAAGNQVLGTAKGTMAAGWTGMKAGAKGVIDFLGGPWAVGIAAAGFVVTSLIDAHNRAQQAQENMNISVRDGVAAQTDFQAALLKTNGVLEGNAEATSAAARIAKGELAEFTELGEAYSGWIYQVKSDTSLLERTFTNSGYNQYEQDRAKAHELRAAYKQLQDTMKDMGVTMEDLDSIVAEGGDEYKQLIAKLRESGEAGNQAADQLEAARAKIEDMAKDASLIDDDFAGIQNGMRGFADAAGDATSQMNSLYDAMEAAGLIESTAQENAFAYADSLRQLNEEIGTAYDQQGQFGDALFDASGNLDVNSENAAVLNGQMRELADSYQAAVAGGMDANEAWDQMGPTMQAIAEATGLPIEKIEELVRQYGAVPEKIETYIGVQGAGETAADIATVHMKLDGLPEGEEVHLGALTDDAVKKLDDLGIELKEVGEGVYSATVDAETEEGLGKIEDFMDVADQLGTEPYEVDMLLNTDEIEGSAQYATELLDALNLENPSPEAQLIMDEFLAGRDLTYQELAILSSQTADPKADLLKDLFDSKMDAAHIRADEFGRLKKSATADVKDQATPKLTGILGLLNKIPGVRQATVLVQRVFGGGGRADGGLVGLADGGVAALPTLAQGDMAEPPLGPRYGAPGGGYRLPLAGPGTERTDGILGIGSDGLPTAWVDAGEYVTNRASTARWPQLLRAINEGQAKDVALAALAELPSFESGGEVSRRVKDELAFMHGTPYVWGGWTPAGVDCSGAISLGVNSALGLDPFDSRTATMAEGQWLAAKGFQPGEGDGDDLVVAYYNGGPYGGHTAMVLPDGTYIESGGNTGGGFTIGSPAGPLTGRGFTDFWHLPYDDDGEEYYGDDGTTIGGNGTRSKVTELKARKGRAAAKAHKPDGGVYHVPGFASNVAGGGGGGGAIRSAARTAGYGGQFDGIADRMDEMRNPFISTNTFADMIGPALAEQAISLAAQHGFEAAVKDALGTATPNWDVWLRVNEDTIDAFNELSEARDERADVAQEITDAEKDLKNAREELAKLTEDGAGTDEQSAKKVEKAEEKLAKAREANGSNAAERVADAEKELAEARAEDAENQAAAADEHSEQVRIATQNIKTAEENLAGARSDEVAILQRLAAAEENFRVQMMIAPVLAVADFTSGLSSALDELAESMERLGEAAEDINELVQDQTDAELRAIDGKINFQQAVDAQMEAERALRYGREQDRRAEQQAEWDLAMARHEASRIAGAAEVDLAALREAGIFHVAQIATAADQAAFQAASDVALQEAQLANVRAQAQQNEFDNSLALQTATAELEYAQVMAEIQAEKLALASQELADAQAKAAGQLGQTTAMSKEMAGRAKEASGASNIIGGGARIAGALALIATGVGAPLGIAMLAQGAGQLGKGVNEVSVGRAQRKTWEEEAQTEYAALSDEDKRRIDGAKAGIVMGGIAGTVAGLAGGSGDDVKAIMEGVAALGRSGLDAEATRRVEQAALADYRRKKTEDRIDLREKEAELKLKKVQLEQLESSHEQRNYLAELVAMTGQSLEEHQQENNQLKGLNDKLADRQRSVLMSIGGSQLGDGETGAFGLASGRVDGFGGLTRDRADEWSSINVEAGWQNLELVRQVVPLSKEAREVLEEARAYIDGLPDTVVDGHYQPVEGAVDSATMATVKNIESMLSRLLDERKATPAPEPSPTATQHPGVGTQFTGPVTINSNRADDTINELARQLAR